MYIPRRIRSSRRVGCRAGKRIEGWRSTRALQCENHHAPICPRSRRRFGWLRHYCSARARPTNPALCSLWCDHRVMRLQSREARRALRGCLRALWRRHCARGRKIDTLNSVSPRHRAIFNGPHWSPWLFDRHFSAIINDTPLSCARWHSYNNNQAAATSSPFVLHRCKIFPISNWKRNVPSTSESKFAI